MHISACVLLQSSCEENPVQFAYALQTLQAVANGEATLNNTIAAFLGRFEPPIRPRNNAQAPAAQTEPGTLGRRLQQANNYLVQSGEYSPLSNISTPES